ncbi:hypothetical protein VE00_05038 [Pseudogymnoascus sp. WSF 3629]|nr:hypothetical protein VE00_05038 [Pseudogymnoascus sp. WSF 3629]
MITEIATFELVSPADLSDPSSPTRLTLHTFLAALVATDGAHAGYFGQSAENPDTVIIFIDWDNTEAHHHFLTTPTYDRLSPSLFALMNRSTLKIIHLPPIPRALLGEQEDVNVTEVLFFYFRASLTDEDIAGIDARMDGLRPALESSEMKGVYDGWAEEEDAVFEGAGGEQRCKVWVHVVGWESMEAHERMVKGGEFENSREVVKQMEGLRGMVMFHAKLVKV